MALKEILAIVITGDGSGAVREFERVGKTAERELGKAEAGSARFGASMQKTGAIAIGVGALMIGASVKAAEAAAAQEQADLKLANTLRNMPQLAGANISAFTGQAQALQKVTAASDEEVEAAQSMLGQFGLTERQILKMTPLLLDYARKTGKDMESAAKDVGKALEGKTKALESAGVRIDKAVYSTDRYRAVTDALSRSVGGFAEEEGKTFAGQLAIMRHQMEETDESIGRGAIPVLGKLAGGVKTAADAFNSMPEGAREVAGTTLAAGGALLIVGGAATTIVGKLLTVRAAMKAAEEGGSSFGQGLKGLAPAAMVAGVAMGVIIDRVSKVRQAEQEAADAANKVWSGLDFTKAREEHDGLVKRQEELTKAMNDTNVAGRTFSRLGEGFGMDTLAKEYDDVNRRLEAMNPAMEEASRRTAGLAKVMGTTQSDVEGLLSQLKLTPEALTQIGDQQRVADVLMRLKTHSIDVAEAQRILADMTKQSAGAAGESASAAEEEVQALQKVRSEVTGVYEAHKSYANAVKGVETAQRAAVTAEKAVGDAQREAAKSAEAVTDAVRNASKARERIADAEQSYADSVERVSDAERSYQDSLERVQDAVAKVSKAEQKLEEIRNSAAEYALRREEAQLRVSESRQKIVDAEKELHKARATGTADDVAKAETDLARAKLDQEKAKGDAQKEAGKQAEDQAAAEKELADAHKAVTDAEREGENAAKAVERAKRDVAKAAEGVRDAEYDARKATDAVRDAQYQAASAADRIRDAQIAAKDAHDHVRDAEDQAAGAAINLHDKVEDLNTTLEANPGIAGKVVEQLQAIAAASPEAADGIQAIIDSLGVTQAGKALSNFSTSLATGITKSFGGARAAGGPMPGGATGRWYVAGENGPEPIFVPSTGGAVAFASSGMAKTMGMGHGGDVHFHIGSIQGSDPHAVVERMERRARTKLAAVG